MPWNTQEVAEKRLKKKIFEYLLGPMKAEEITLKTTREAVEIAKLCGDETPVEDWFNPSSCVLQEVDKRAKKIIEELDI